MVLKIEYGVVRQHIVLVDCVWRSVVVLISALCFSKDRRQFHWMVGSSDSRWMLVVAWWCCVLTTCCEKSGCVWSVVSSWRWRKSGCGRLISCSESQCWMYVSVRERAVFSRWCSVFALSVVASDCGEVVNGKRENVELTDDLLMTMCMKNFQSFYILLNSELACALAFRPWRTVQLLGWM